MITWAALRSSAAPWLVLPALVYAGLYVGASTPNMTPEYGVSSGELAAYGLAVIAPAVAGAAAWDAGRHRLLGALRTVGARGRARQFLRAAVPAATLHLVLVASMLVMARWGVGVWPSGAAGWLAVAHLLVLPAGWLVIGWFLGEVLPRSAAAPVAAIGCWSWLSLPHAVEPPWIRHLGGLISSGSSIMDLRRPSAYLVPWAVTAGVALALWLFVHARRRAWGAALGVLVLTVTLVTGRALVHDWGFDRPTSPRNVALTCVGEAPRVCVPPEYGRHAERLREDALVPLARLAAAGVTPPRELRFTSGEDRLEPGTWPLYWGPPRIGSPPPADPYEAEPAESSVVGTAALAGRTDCRAPTSLAAGWASLVIGKDERAVRPTMSDADWAVLQEVRRLPAEKQLGWFERGTASGELCERAVG
ncbi:DUF7224 domain-containing protein [Streptomyces laurentii]|uniref:DUF7224 domain-containing protein n=1 Tax=Streptomyces laurentii TaxID=39478 RepID=UPI0036B23C70